MDIVDYQKSINSELKVVQNRVRNLIGSAHWGEEGRYKETALRTVLNRMLPSNISIGTGFIVDLNNVSSQIDIIIWDNSYPILFKDGDFVIVSPVSVKGIVEVKTRLSASNISSAIQHAAQNGNFLKRGTFNGIFAFESDLVQGNNIKPSLKNALKESSVPVNHLALGEDTFIKFWSREQVFSSDGSLTKDEYSVYKINGFAFSYFISNIITDTSAGKGENLSWFLYPIENGKEAYKIDSIYYELGKGINTQNTT